MLSRNPILIVYTCQICEFNHENNTVHNLKNGNLNLTLYFFLQTIAHDKYQINEIGADMFCFRKPYSSSYFFSSLFTVSLYKRAQILVADIWACFEGQGHGRFADIDTLTMFADYR